MGSVHKRATKKGTVRWLGRYRDEDRKEHSRSFDTRKEAAAWVSSMESQGRSPDDFSPTVSEVFDPWMSREGVAESSRMAYRLTRNNLSPILDLRVGEITSSVLNELWVSLTTGRPWVSKTDTGLAHKPARTVISRLRSSVIAWAENHPSFSPPADLLSWRAPRERLGAPSRIDPRTLPDIGEVKSVASIMRRGHRATYIADGIRKTPSLADAMELCAVTGLRIGELVALDVDAIDHQRGEVSVRQQFTDRGLEPLKTASSYRTVPVPEEVNGLLVRLVTEALSREVPDGWSSQPLFVHERNGPWLPGSAGVVLRKAQRIRATRKPGDGPRYSSAKDIRVWGWHALRHLYASTLIAQGRPITDVSAALGHSSPAITAEFYAHPLAGRESAIRKAASSLVVSSRPVPRTDEEHRLRYGDEDDW